MHNDQEHYTHLNSLLNSTTLKKSIQKLYQYVSLGCYRLDIIDPPTSYVSLSRHTPALTRSQRLRKWPIHCLCRIRRGILYERTDLGNGHWSQSWKENEDQVTGRLGGRYNREL